MTPNRIATCTLVCLMLGAGLVRADALDQALSEGQAKTAAAQQSQRRIDQLAEQTREQERQYRQVLKQSQGLEVYLGRLESQIANQQQRLQDIEASVEQVTVVQRQMPFVIERMIDALDEFIGLDFPFYLEERRQRIAFLRANLAASNLSVAEKFRQVMEAYQIEIDYGRKVSSYQGEVEVEPGVMRKVTLLHVGRVALMYQTRDTEVSGTWDPRQRQWVSLDAGAYRKSLRQAIRIADNQAAKDILTVPVAAPEAPSP